jgi:hypothetical protein
MHKFVEVSFGSRRLSYSGRGSRLARLHYVGVSLISRFVELQRACIVAVRAAKMLDTP